MRIFSIFLNILLFIVVIALVADEGLPSKIKYQIMIGVFFITPVFTLITLWKLQSEASESWLSLFLQRKKLEEKVKLQKLKNSGN